jgi:hypothetical protein
VGHAGVLNPVRAAGPTPPDYGVADVRRSCDERFVGANPHPSVVLLAYTSAELLALVPFTPGGLGFVEAGLAGTLTLAGLPGGDALAATLLYRLVSYWLPVGCANSAGGMRASVLRGSGR